MPVIGASVLAAEVGHVLRPVLAGELTVGREGAALTDLAAFPLRRAGHVGLVERAWELRRNVTFYDALYVALAARLGMPLVTRDARLAGATGVRAAIDVVV